MRKYARENIASSQIKIVVPISKWEEYRVIENNEHYLTIEGFNKFDAPKDVFEEIIEDNDKVFWDLLVLFCKLSDCKYNYNNKKINDTITENDIKLILSFCSKYGLPCSCDTPTANICLPYSIIRITNYICLPCSSCSCEETTGNICSLCLYKELQAKEDITKTRYNMLHSVYPMGLTNRFVIASFVVALFNLYRDFLQVIAYNKNNENSSLYDDLKPLITTWGKKYIYDIQPILNNEGLQLFTPSLCPFTTFWEYKDNRLHIHCNNLYHLAIYHLCLFASQKAFTGGYVKQCKHCGNFFVAEKKNIKYCNDPCNRKEYYSYMKRKKT